MGREATGFDIQEYMTEGVERVVKDALRATVKDPKGSAFMAGFAISSARASKKRREAEKKGEHIPPFLIASITSNCNLHCAGCYSRANHATTDCAPQDQLSCEDWLKIFEEADALGISFILLAGGEPMLRKDVIEAAGNIRNILFPIFTNGVLLNEEYMKLLEKRRNLIPIISIEGGKASTDSRRGSGIYDRVMRSMDALHASGLIYGCSVTVTTENMEDVLSEKFISSLSEKGCKAVIYVEYVPVTEESGHLAIGDPEREIFSSSLQALRTTHPEIVFVSFPGDEKSSGGCIAAGRGFFHINSHGGAEPCPFSPYSDMNVRDTSLKEALSSPLFLALQDQHVLTGEHSGGCVLFEKKAQVEALLHH